MPLKSAFKATLDLKFLQQHAFESVEQLGMAERSPAIVRNTLRLLMMGWSPHWKQFMTSSIAYALFVKRDPLLLKEWRLAFQQGFLELYEQLKDKTLTSDEHEQVQLYLSNCLTLLPYSDITPYESFKIPQFVDNHWELVEYQVHPLELTNNKGWRRFFMEDKDRVFAYGLEPLFHKKAESHLIFLGTTYPAGQGFLTQLQTDVKGFETVGLALYLSGRERLKKWLAMQPGATHVCGVSLGGSLALSLAIDDPKDQYKLSRVDALNPAGLHDDWFVNPHDHWGKLKEKPQVVIQKQGNDFVSAFGIWKDDWEVLEVNPPRDKRGTNSFHDHFLNYAGFVGTTFTYVDPKQDNSRRKTRNFLLYSLGRSLVYYGLLLPYSYIFRPISSAIAHHWIELSIVTALAVAACIALVSLIPVFLITVGCVYLGFGINYLYRKGKGIAPELALLAKTKAELAQLHDPALPRNASMNIYCDQNKVDISLTYKQLGTYYKVTRELIKGKKLLPEHDVSSQYINGITKKALIIQSLDPEQAEKVVTLNVKKAKAAHINRVLRFVDKLGIDSDELKTELLQKHAEYSLGKQQKVPG